MRDGDQEIQPSWITDQKDRNGLERLNECLCFSPTERHHGILDPSDGGIPQTPRLTFPEPSHVTELRELILLIGTVHVDLPRKPVCAVFLLRRTEGRDPPPRP